MKIGIPRALLYHYYGPLWEAFFRALDCEVVLSAPTTKATVERGSRRSIDEACLSSKIYMGHAEELLDRCDALFVPRMADEREGIMCSKFEALYDLTENTFRDRKPALVDFEIDRRAKKGERKAFVSLGKKLGKGRLASNLAYFSALRAFEEDRSRRAAALEDGLNADKLKFLVLAHPYVIFDDYVGRPLVELIRAQGAEPVFGCDADFASCLQASYRLTESLPWSFSRALCGAAVLYANRVDGIVLVSAFPCGPDSLVNEILIRRVRNRPILQLTLDAQDGTAGVETRLESFADVIRMRREAGHER